MNFNETNNLSVLEYCNNLSKKENIIFDESQKKAIIVLDKLWQDLVIFKKKRNKFLGKILFHPKLPKGIYICGDVGRGKSFLMDIFYSCLPYNYKKRVHFHKFMEEIHKRLGRLKHKNNPIDTISLELSKEIKVLCFDEFHISDIADAMILGNLLLYLIKYGIVIIITSNYSPNELYTNGLNRSSFISTIDFIYKNFNIININGEIDYRLRDLKMAPVFYPNTKENNINFEKLFNKITENKEQKENIIKVCGREISSIKNFEQVIWFDFHTLCFTNRSQQDYLFLAENYGYIFISDIKRLSSLDKDVARRFTWLIDILYDFKVKLFLTINCKLEEIYIEGDFAQEFTRTISRLIEMQSLDYLNNSHILYENYKKS